jgi:hypothetical protein
MTTTSENKGESLFHCACGRPELGLDTATDTEETPVPPNGVEAPSEAADTQPGTTDDRRRGDAAQGAASRSKA